MNVNFLLRMHLDKASKKIFSGSCRSELVKTKELVLPWTSLIDLEIARKAEGFSNGHSVSESKKEGFEEILLYIWPLG